MSVPDTFYAKRTPDDFNTFPDLFSVIYRATSMWRPGQRASVLMALLFCFLLSFERNPVADKAPGPEWDGNGILQV